MPYYCITKILSELVETFFLCKTRRGLTPLADDRWPE